MQAEDLIDLLNFRYATKVFDPNRIIGESTWSILEESMQLTPSSFGLQPWRFYVIHNKETRASLREVSWGQGQVTDASHLVVMVARTDLDQFDVDRWISRLSEVQGTPVESLSSYSEMILSFSSNMSVEEKQAWNTRQVYIALGQLMSGAAMLGIDTCPLEGISPSDYDRILQLEGTGYTTAVACALGYRAESDKYAQMPKARFSLENLIFYK